MVIRAQDTYATICKGKRGDVLADCIIGNFRIVSTHTLASADGSISTTSISKDDLEQQLREIRDLKPHIITAISDDERLGKNGIDHLAINTARGHMVGYAGDNFRKAINRARWIRGR